jgi:hypothetical protein
MDSSGFCFVDIDLTEQNGNDGEIISIEHVADLMAATVDQAKNGLVVRPHLLKQ